MTRLRALHSSLLLGTGLALGYASPAAQVTASDVVDAVVPTHTFADAAAFERLLNVAPRIVESGSAEAALKEMGLHTSGRKAMSWLGRTGGAGNYVFSNVSGEDSDGIPFSFDSVAVSGLRMEDGDPVFDRIDMTGFKSREDYYSITIGQWSMSDVPPALATALVRTFREFDAEDVFSDQFEDQDVGLPGAMFLEGLSMDIDDDDLTGEMKLSVLGWGSDKATEKGRFLMRGFDFSGESKNGDLDAPLAMSLGDMTASGIDMEVLREIIEKIDLDELDEKTYDRMSLMMYQDPYKKIYDSYAVNNIKITYDALNMGLEHYGSKMTKVGDILTYKTLMKPMTVSFSGEAKDENIAEMRQVMTESGFESLSLTAGATTILNETYDRFQIKDAYYDLAGNGRMDFVMAGKGLKPVIAALSEIEDTEEMSDAQALAAFKDASVDYMDLSYTDMSMMDKIFGLAAKDAGVTPDLMKTKAKASLMMGAMMAQNPAQMAFATQSSEALTKLIDEGGTLDIKIRPETPLTLDSFAGFDPSTFDPADYGLSISHRK